MEGTRDFLRGLRAAVDVARSVRGTKNKTLADKAVNAYLNGISNIMSTGFQAEAGGKTVWSSPGSNQDMTNMVSKAASNASDRVREKYSVDSKKQEKNVQVEEPKAAVKTPEVVEEEGEKVTYTYRPGDTFGQVLLNLGLSDGSNLWGQGGDVDFYTQQLRAQNALDLNGNIPIGTTFTLRKRK